MKDRNIDLLTDALKEMGIRCDTGAADKFLAYLRLLKKWSGTYNLTSITDDREIVIKHFIDSTLFLKALPETAKTLLDIGSGAGFPGVPVKIIRPELSVCLIEPSRKKAAFLRKLIKELALKDISVAECRIEQYPCGDDELPLEFDIVTTRALFKVSEMMEKASRFVKGGGIMVLSKGPSYVMELEGLGDHAIEVISAEAGAYGMDRNLIVVRK